MIRHIIILSVLIAFSANAYADFSTGIDAYTKKDYVTALKEFKTVADQGNPDAQFMLGYMYASGKGVLQDYIKAHMWFNLSASQGNERAMESRDKIVKAMTPQQIAEAQRLARQWKAEESPEESTTMPYPAELTGKDLVREIQERLGELGYEPGPADGMMGEGTRQAIRTYQKQAALTVDGEPSQGLLTHIREKGEMRVAQINPPEEDLSSSSAPGGSQGMKGPLEEQTLEFIGQLKKIVKRGEDQNSADSDFLALLRELINQYDWPWPELLFHDDFKDGNLTGNPAWNIVSGDFRVDSESRLITRVRAAEQERDGSLSRQDEDTGTMIVKSILGELLKEKGTESSPQSRPVKAELYARSNITNSFCMDIQLAVISSGDDAVFEVGPYKGKRRDKGYRLVYYGGQRPRFELARQSYRRTSIIDVYESASLLNDGRSHRIRWERNSDGNIVVSVDGKEIMNTIDRSIKGAFDGISIINQQGDYAVSLIDIFGGQK